MSYEATRVVFLGICRITGCIERTYATGDSAAYFVLVIKRPRCLCVNPPRVGLDIKGVTLRFELHLV